MLKKIKYKTQNFNRACSELKNNIVKVSKGKLFWCESIIIVSFLMFTVTNFILNLFLGMYILSFSMFGIALFIWRYF